MTENSEQERRHLILNTATRLTPVVRKLMNLPLSRRQLQSEGFGVGDELMSAIRLMPDLLEKIAGMNACILAAREFLAYPDGVVRAKAKRLVDMGSEFFGPVQDPDVRNLLMYFMIGNVCHGDAEALRGFTDEEALRLERVKMLRTLGGDEAVKNPKTLKRLKLVTVLERALDSQLYVFPESELGQIIPPTDITTNSEN